MKITKITAQVQLGLKMTYSSEKLIAIGNMVEAARRGLRLTTSQVGKMAGVPAHVVSSVESGELSADNIAIELVLSAVHVPIDFVDDARRGDSNTNH